MVKSKKKPENDANKIHVTMSLNRELHSKIKEIGVNLSAFVERALNWLYSNVTAGNIQVFNEKTLILSPDLQNKLKNECCAPDLNRRFRDYESRALLGLESEKKANSDDFKISQVSRFEGLKPSAEILDGDMLPPDGGYSMADFMRSRESDYRRWKRKSGVSDESTDKYFNAMKTLSWLKTYDDLKKHEGLTKTEKDGIQQVAAYMRDWADIGLMFNGVAVQTFSDRARDDYSIKIGSRSNQKTKELIGRPDVLERVLETLPDDVAMFYVMCCFGARVAQLCRLYEKPLNITMSDDKQYFWVNAEEVGKGHKKAFYYFFPSWMLPVVKNWRNVRSSDVKYPEKQFSKIVNDVSRVADESVPANLSSLRKFAKAVTTESGLQDNVAEFTQGRLPQGVGAKAYDNLEFAAKRDFGMTLPFWKERVIFPAWMSDEEEIKKRLAVVEKDFVKSKAAHSRKKTIKTENGGRQQLSDEKRANIISRLKRGESRRKIADAVKVARATVDKIAADLKAKGEL